ncbi:MAG: hypothetical protein CMF31_03500 [Kordiimonas sp.]|nr:hypothetical protein [Kordiimonas sp.]
MKPPYIFELAGFLPGLFFGKLALFCLIYKKLQQPNIASHKYLRVNPMENNTKEKPCEYRMAAL